MRPARLFDTELAGRLLGDERVALGTMVEKHLGRRGWRRGTRPPTGRPARCPTTGWSTPRSTSSCSSSCATPSAGLLDEAGKSEWAAQEFEAVRTGPAAAPRVEPWRRTSGIHRLRNRRQLAVVRALWHARDEYAAERDIAPGRVLPDAAIVDAARTSPARAARPRGAARLRRPAPAPPARAAGSAR